jgi:hypothetical protein
LKSKIEKRFQLLLSLEELNELKNESIKRNITASELLRIGLRNEISKRTSLERLNALKELCNLNLK